MTAPEGNPAAGGWTEPRATALLVLADGTVLEGFGLGAVGEAPGEVCFNTAMTGYQEILTDPSYAGQIITFTFPHVGNVGVNEEDTETVNAAASSGVRGCVLHAAITEPSNWRANRHFDAWLKARNIVGICGVDTRALTALIRDNGMPNAILAHSPDGVFDIERLKKQAAGLPSMAGLDLVPLVTAAQRYDWDETPWVWPAGYGKRDSNNFKVVAIDYGVKRNILRLLAKAGCDVTVVPSTATAADILSLNPDGIFLSNGPGDPAATGEYAVPVIKELLDKKVPTFGICLGHQMMALAIGGQTMKMKQGHHGANHPVQDKTTGKVEIVSMNHGFAVDPASLPTNAVETHVSLFDGSNSGIALTDRPAFSVQHHPEASPGPQDSHYLFTRFTELMAAEKAKKAGLRAVLMPKETGMIHQLRIYEIFERNKAAFHARFRDHAARIMARHGFRIVAMWETASAGRTEFAYILAWPDIETKTAAWASFMADPEWSEIKRVTKIEHGDMVGAIEDRILTPTAYSPPLD